MAKIFSIMVVAAVPRLYTECFLFFWPHRAACGILVQWPGIKRALSALEAWIAREVWVMHFKVMHYMVHKWHLNKVNFQIKMKAGPILCLYIYLHLSIKPPVSGIWTRTCQACQRNITKDPLVVNFPFLPVMHTLHLTLIYQSTHKIKAWNPLLTNPTALRFPETTNTTAYVYVCPFPKNILSSRKWDKEASDGTGCNN